MKMNPGGNFTWTLLVFAFGRSFGTRTSTRLKPPAGASVGWRVTCACAAGATSRADAATSVAIRMDRFIFCPFEVGLTCSGQSRRRAARQATREHRRTGDARRSPRQDDAPWAEAARRRGGTAAKDPARDARRALQQQREHYSEGAGN